LSCSLKNTTNHSVEGQDVLPWWSSMFWPAAQYWSMLFENVEKRRIISFYFQLANST